MGSVWGLALSLLFFCWEAGGSRSSAGLSTGGPVPLVTTNNTEVPAMTEGIKTSSESAFQTTGLHEPSMSHVSSQTQTLNSQTTSKTFTTANKSKETRTTSPSRGVRETPTISPLQENWAFSKIIAPTTAAEMTTPGETLAPRSSRTRRRVHRGAGSHTIPRGAIFANPCTSESSEEAHWITVDHRADTAKEVKSLSSESSSSSDSSVSTLSSSQALTSGTLTQAKALAAYRILHLEFTNCSITKIETAAIMSKTSGRGPRPTEGEMALSTSASPHSPEAKSYIPNTTAYAEASSSASTMESAVLETAKMSNSRRTWVTVPRKPLEETSVLSFETSSHTEVPGALSASMVTGSTRGKVPSFASASVDSPSDTATIKDSTPSEMLTTAGAANRAFPTSRSPPSTIHSATATSSHTPSLTSEATFQTTALPESSVPSPVPNTAAIPKTIITAGTVSEADIRESQATSPTPETTETPTNSPAVETSGTLAISSTAETTETQATSPTVTPHISPAKETLGTMAISPDSEIMEMLTISFDTEILRSQSTSPATELEGILTDSPTAEIMETSTVFPATQPMKTLHTFPVAGTRIIGTISSALELEGTPTIIPAAETRETPAISTATQTMETPSFPVTETIPPYSTRSGTHMFVSDTAASKNSSPLASSTIDSSTHRSIPTSRNLLPSIHPTTASGSPLPSDHLITVTSSQEINTTFIKTTASPMTPRRPLTSTASFWSKQTMGVTAGGDGGFLLVRLSVASSEDLTEPSVVEKLMEQLRCELLTHKLFIHVSLLQVKRG